MTELMALSLSTGILCGIWTGISGPLGLIGWAGFAGCTTYFATGKKGFDGFFTTVRQNLLGVLCGMLIIILSGKFNFAYSDAFFSGLLTFVMCIAGKFKLFSFIPGTFVGSFSTFAADGDWKVLIVSLILGAILGVACDKGGVILYSATSGEK